ncbi:MAG: ABC transporter permease [Saprospiraceae bacterium]|nr:ABC transporter permease [Candidatus Vicinibacter affinis]
MSKLEKLKTQFYHFLSPIRDFKRRQTFVFYSLICFGIILFFIQFIVAPHPFLCRFKGENYSMLWQVAPPDGSPLKSEMLAVGSDWKKIQFEFAMWPLFVYDPYQNNQEDSWKKPFTGSDGSVWLLGTYELGKDVLSNCLYGLRKSLLIALMSVLFALVIGLPVGLGLSYYHSNGLKVSFVTWLFGCILLLLLGYLFLVFIEYRILSFQLVLIFFLLSAIFIFLFRRGEKNRHGIKLFPDRILLNWISLMKSFPIMLVLLLCVQWVQKPGVVFLSMIMGIFFSVSVSKYVRYLSISESQETYIKSMKAFGYSDARIIWVHLMPKILLDIFPLLALGMGSSILAEASLSFLGLGLPVEEISLGNMMHSARNYPSAWWVVLFPGLCVFWLVYTFQMLGKAFDAEEHR